PLRGRPRHPQGDSDRVRAGGDADARAGAGDRRALATPPQPRVSVPVGVAGRGARRLVAMRFRFVIGLLAVLMVALGSVVVALVIRSNEVDHFHTQQTDETLRAARQAEAVAQLSVGELATAG